MAIKAVNYNLRLEGIITFELGDESTYRLKRFLLNIHLIPIVSNEQKLQRNLLKKCRLKRK